MYVCAAETLSGKLTRTACQDSAPDVYETFPTAKSTHSPSDDLGAESDPDKVDVPSSDAIDTGSVSATRAAERFRATRPAFLDAESFGLHGTVAQSESLFSRLFRLQQEAKDLQRALTERVNTRSEPANAASMLTQLEHLEQHIRHMRTTAHQEHPHDITQAMVDALQHIPPSHETRTQPVAHFPPSHHDGMSTQHLAVWDERLSALERRLGLHVTKEDVPLIETVKRLEAHMQLLTQPRHLDTIVARAKALASELERVDERRKQFSAAAEEEDALAKLDELYAMQKRIEPLEPLAPAILSRLQTLAPLHSAAAHFHTSLADVEAQQTALQTRQTELQALLHKVEQSLQENQAVTQRNMQSLMTRLDALRAAPAVEHDAGT